MFLSQRKSNTEHIVIVLLFIISIGIHYFFMVDGFGEQDSVMLAISARMWHDADSTCNSYIYKVSPLYLSILRSTLQLGFPANLLGDLMNWASLIIGSLTLIPMFYLFKKINNFEVAIMGCLLYSFTPAFWIANIYGMPMIHAFFWFLISLLLFIDGLAQNGRWFYIMMLFSMLFACVSLNFKADIVLCYGTYLGVIIYLRQTTLKNTVFSLLIPLVSLASVLVFSRVLFQEMGAPLANPTVWNQRFPFTLEAITNEINFSVIPKSVGKWIFLAIAIAVLICLFKKDYRRQLLLVIFGATPTFLFWGFKMGNSARHMMVAYYFLVFMLAFVLFEITKRYKYWPVFFVGLIVINYFSCEAGGEPYRPSSRIFSMTNLIEKQVIQFNKFGTEFFSLPYPNKIYVGGWESPYIIWRVYCMASRVEHLKTEKEFCLRIYDENENSQEIKFKYLIIGRDRDSLGPIPGWYLWTCNESLKIYN